MTSQILLIVYRIKQVWPVDGTDKFDTFWNV